VGQGYRLVATPGSPVLTGTVSVQYLENDVLVAGVAEEDLSIYYHDGAAWRELETRLNAYYNLVSAQSAGEGVYALLASVRVPLRYPGWNLISYPLRETQVVTEALASIEGQYAIVYGYDGGDPVDPWRVYAVDVPGYVNDLHELVFGRGYWISATEAVTIHLSSGVSADGVSDPLAGPPATYYGTVEAGGGFTPTAGMAVQAYVGDHVCGQGETQAYGGEIVYVVNVSADGPGGAAGCGKPGDEVTFYVDEQTMTPTAVWDNNLVWEVDLAADTEREVYLPLVMRNH
jgi:hypothetical protein